ncbi:sister chromatid cohesion protein PDS5 homolog A [Striga asiatica]|uniref:Sister chromatid cohesion protein PDS5 homolog A n=1 Tax=Striga asiatica TaxID=4170 RepID=A0A5A7PS91_STRAF|nr:sister chromatid cohesion protein PDS5 homolog A [Striga asiatica]
MVVRRLAGSARGGSNRRRKRLVAASGRDRVRRKPRNSRVNKGRRNSSRDGGGTGQRLTTWEESGSWRSWGLVAGGAAVPSGVRDGGGEAEEFETMEEKTGNWRLWVGP